MRSWFTAGAVEVPVPPFDTPRMPESAVMDGDVVADMMPFVACTKPFKEEARVVVPKTFSVPVAVRFVEVALPVMKVSPTTVRADDGVVVPMPTLPFDLIMKAVAPEEEAMFKRSVVPKPVTERLEEVGLAASATSAGGIGSTNNNVAITIAVDVSG